MINFCISLYLALHIINAPKSGNSTYINYEDICYSQTGGKRPQMFLQHILPWNLLLVGCSNSMEIGVLGTTDINELPIWKQYILVIVFVFILLTTFYYRNTNFLG